VRGRFGSSWASQKCRVDKMGSVDSQEIDGCAKRLPRGEIGQDLERRVQNWYSEGCPDHYWDCEPRREMCAEIETEKQCWPADFESR